MDEREIICRRAAKELRDGMIVNLGFGMPLGVADFIPEGVHVWLETENGGMGYGGTPTYEEADCGMANAGAGPITKLPGMSVFDLSYSFQLIRGGHVDATILGCLEVDEEGNAANWALPIYPGANKYQPGMGGGMDLMFRAKKVIIAMSHTAKGAPKLVKKCQYPITAPKCAHMVITEKAVFELTENGYVLKEIWPGLTVEDIRKITEANFTVAEDLKEYQI
ncbi:MAG: 3-oxoacid CoA-transferase subunit B [Bacillota bacterium]|jgi:3-oxoacid CoA-transferase B subunit|nr:3-oxoacid CoA-transferase subunit B [Bacillota bacterium]